MRRSASEIINNLEMRIARLEGRVARDLDDYATYDRHPSYVPSMGSEAKEKADDLAYEMSLKFRGTDLKVEYMPDWVGYMVTSKRRQDLTASPEIALGMMMDIMGVRGRIKLKGNRGSVVIPMGDIELVLKVSPDEGASFNAYPVR